MMLTKERYTKTVVPALREKFGYANIMAVPKIEKVVVNIGIGHSIKDPNFTETAEATLRKITGQKPIKTVAKKSISNFKIRQGQAVGMVVTLRGKRMYDFLDKLINITSPRVRDFRGLNPKAIDSQGNLHIGLREHVAFPEIDADEVDRIHGLQVSVATTASTHDEGLELLRQLGFPFQTS